MSVSTLMKQLIDSYITCVCSLWRVRMECPHLCLSLTTASCMVFFAVLCWLCTRNMSAPDTTMVVTRVTAALFIVSWSRQNNNAANSISQSACAARGRGNTDQTPNRVKGHIWIDDTNQKYMNRYRVFKYARMHTNSARHIQDFFRILGRSEENIQRHKLL